MRFEACELVWKTSPGEDAQIPEEKLREHELRPSEFRTVNAYIGWLATMGASAVVRRNRYGMLLIKSDILQVRR